MTAILKTWTVGKFTCKLWKHSDTVYRGCLFLGSDAVACAEVLIRDGQTRAEEAVEALAPVMDQSNEPQHITDTTPIYDVILVPEPQGGPDDSERLYEPFQLTKDLEIIPVNDSVAKIIFAACDPPGRNYNTVIDLRSPLYAFVRSEAPQYPLYGWDTDGKLKLCLALSRLVHMTSASFQYAVRLIGSIHHGQSQVVPGPVRGLGSLAWTSTPERDWLGRTELHDLRELVARFTENPFDARSRLSQALWHYEYTAWTYYVDTRLPFITTAIETLLSTDSSHSTRHVTKRLPLLAELVGGPSITNKEASRLWGLRSALVHGSKHGGLKDDDFKLYTKVENVLRATLRKGVVTPTIRDIFSTPTNVDATFPIPPPPPKTVVCPSCASSVEIPR